jgi:hypothetical protein
MYNVSRIKSEGSTVNEYGMRKEHAISVEGEITDSEGMKLYSSIESRRLKINQKTNLPSPWNHS